MKLPLCVCVGVGVGVGVECMCVSSLDEVFTWPYGVVFLGSDPATSLIHSISGDYPPLSISLFSLSLSL